MAEQITRNSFTKYDKTLSYLAAGPESGPLLIFIHGWPATAETWKPQLDTFSALGFRCIAPDMPGYGQSEPKRREATDYSLQNIVTQLVNFLKYGLKREDALWAGHDWGSGVVWAFVAHHPELCLGVINMSVPYRTIELGLSELVKYANRDVYPEDEYPHAQWGYQAYYESSDENFEKCVAWYDAHVEKFLKAVYVSGRSFNFDDIKDKPALTSNVLKDGGWFGGADAPPDVDLSSTLLSEELLASMVKDFTAGSFWGPSAYYRNHAINRQWTEDWSVNEGVVSTPVLFIECGMFWFPVT
jgi:soluble epoxide hydrolase / lipid-phosphate phosphatase